MNKEELKKEVGKLNLVDTEFEADGLCYMDGGVSLTQVYDLIDQLDEPEVLSKEWIDRHITDGHNVNLGDKVVYADELDGMLVPKQELPVIPQFVADWWGRDGDSVTMYGGESIDKKRKVHLISNFNDRGLGDHLSKVEDWIDENESSFLDLVNGKVYEVEKEPLYYVQLLEGESCLCEEPFGALWFNNTGLLLESSYKGKMRFTEKEIKDYDERFWAFAVEVAE